MAAASSMEEGIANFVLAELGYFEELQEEDLQASDSSTAIDCTSTDTPSRTRRILFLNLEGVLQPEAECQWPHGTAAFDVIPRFMPECMERLKHLVMETGADLVLTSSWRRFQNARDSITDSLARYGLACHGWTTVAGGESCSVRVSQILAFLYGVDDICTWAVVDHKDLASCAQGKVSEIFGQRFVHTGTGGLTNIEAAHLTNLLLQGGSIHRFQSSKDETKLAELDSEVMMSLIQQCLAHPEAAAWKPPSPIIAVSHNAMHKLWSGLGGVFEVRLHTAQGTFEHAIVMKEISLPNQPCNPEQWRDYTSYITESSFYREGHAKLLCQMEARCPLPLLIECSGEGAMRLFMTQLPGGVRPECGNMEVHAALAWLARLHSLYWGEERAGAAVRTGLQPQGCYWNLDARRLELERTPLQGLEGRMRMAANAFDLRLKADKMQTICHGDAKSTNMIFDEHGSVAFCDFQWTGKAAASKDVVYCLACASASLTMIEEDCYLKYYHQMLCECLATQNMGLPPSLDYLRESYSIAACDLARWMAGWGWWGHAKVLRSHASKLLHRLDGGTALCSEEAYRERIFSVFPP